MFENILGQQQIVDALRRDLPSLPGALMFAGPRYSGKLSTALELARVLTCREGTGTWNCSCRSCEMHRQLLHPDLLLLGGRYFEEEIAACSDVLIRHDRDFARYLFLRSVRKLLRRLDPVLWEGEESRISKAVSSVEKVNDALEEYLPGKPLPAGKKLRGGLARINEECVRIAQILPGDNIPVHQVRRIGFWAHLTSPGERKVVILENADRMQESSRNAMLKMLEEPPAGVTFILLTSRIGGIIPTVRSRVRIYAFRERSEQESRDVLEKIFREPSDEYRDLRSYFLAWKEINVESLRKLAERFLAAAAAGDAGVADRNTGVADRNTGVAEMHEILAELEKSVLPQKGAEQYFLEELLRMLHRNLYAGENQDGPEGGEAIGIERVASWSAMIREVSERSEQYRMSPLPLLEVLFYTMKRDVVNGKR